MRVTSLDRLKVAGQVLSYREESETGYVFEAADRPSVQFIYSFAEFADLLERPDVSFEPGFYVVGRQDARKHSGIEIIGALPEKLRSETVWRHAYVDAFLHLEREGKIKRTDGSIRRALPMIEAHVNGQARAVQSGWKNPRAGRKNELRDPPCTKSMRTWVKIFEKGGHSPLALVPRTHRSGNRAARFCPVSLRFLGNAIDAYLTCQRLNKRQVYEKYRSAMLGENERRIAESAPPLEIISRRGVERVLNALDPYFTYIQRHGIDAANRKFALYEEGINAFYPMERIEIDEWKVDLISIFAKLGLLDHLTPAELAELERGRRWLYLAIDCATRCVVGMRLAENPNSTDAIALLQDITRDKSDLALAAGCKSSWNHYGGLNAVVSDLGAAFVDEFFCAAVTDGHGNPERPPGGIPSLRARVERIFGTMGTALMPHLSGRTFSNPAARGDYPSGEMAVLSDDTLMQILVVFIVDIYHNTPHQGLRGETPNNCWNRLAAEKGVAPTLSERRRRLAFGLKDRRRVSGRGVRKFGIDYTCAALREFHLHSHERDVDLRVDLSDLGWIMVCVDGDWHACHALQKCFEGVSYDDWSAAARELRKKYHEEAVLHEQTIFAALKKIKVINDREQRRFGAILHAQTPSGLNRAKEDLFLGLSIEQDVDIEFEFPPDDDLFGRTIPHEEVQPKELPSPSDIDQPEEKVGYKWRFDDDE
jgi:putative transposase